MGLTHDLYRSDALHQLLEECGLTVGELPDAFADKFLLVLQEAVAVSALQQTEQQQV